MVTMLLPQKPVCAAALRGPFWRACAGAERTGGGDGPSRTTTNTELSNREQQMSKFRVVTPKGASFTVAGGGYAYEKEALDPIDAEIVEAPANKAEFIAGARTAD